MWLYDEKSKKNIYYTSTVSVPTSLVKPHALPKPGKCAWGEIIVNTGKTDFKTFMSGIKPVKQTMDLAGEIRQEIRNIKKKNTKRLKALMVDTPLHLHGELFDQFNSDFNLENNGVERNYR